MDALEVSAEQARALADWSVSGPGFLPVALFATKPRFISTWAVGDILAIQGDAYVHLGVEGDIKSAVPSIGAPSD